MHSNSVTPFLMLLAMSFIHLHLACAGLWRGLPLGPRRGPQLPENLSHPVLQDPPILHQTLLQLLDLPLQLVPPGAHQLEVLPGLGVRMTFTRSMCYTGAIGDTSMGTQMIVGYQVSKVGC